MIYASILQRMLIAQLVMQMLLQELIKNIICVRVYVLNGMKLVLIHGMIQKLIGIEKCHSVQEIQNIALLFKNLYHLQKNGAK